MLLFLASTEAFILCNIYSKKIKLQNDIERLKNELENEISKRETERIGRINLQKEIRHEEQLKNEVKGYLYKSIGNIESPFPDRRGTPRQPILVQARGRIKFNKKIIQHEHFHELKDFSHIWILFVFHENTSISTKLPSKIKPPRLHGSKVGCLSTRSPHRPNNIGLSVCEIVNVGNDYIDIIGVDMVDGTPVLDIKPYIPYDIITSDIPLPVTRSLSSITKLRVPEWVYEYDIKIKPVIFSEVALNSLMDIHTQKHQKFCQDYDQAIQFITQVLQQDIRSVHQGRGEEGMNYNCNLDNISLSFTTTEETILITNLCFKCS